MSINDKNSSTVSYTFNHIYFINLLLHYMDLLKKTLEQQYEQIILVNESIVL